MASLPLLVDNPEEWAAQYDRKPTLIPVWPDSDRLTMVVVVENPDTGTTTGCVLTTRADLDRAAHPLQPGRRLFFRVPKGIVAEVCPEVASEDAD